MKGKPVAKIHRVGAEVNTIVVLELSEDEVGALDALAGYGTDSFLKVFYANLGEAYMKPYENGIRKLFKSIEGCKRELKAAEECRKFLTIDEDRRQSMLRDERNRLRNISRIA
jgi:hypothetical protein